jgi:hypothetical protein
MGPSEARIPLSSKPFYSSATMSWETFLIPHEVTTSSTWRLKMNLAGLLGRFICACVLPLYNRLCLAVNERWPAPLCALVYIITQLFVFFFLAIFLVIFWPRHRSVSLASNWPIFLVNSRNATILTKRLRLRSFSNKLNTYSSLTCFPSFFVHQDGFVPCLSARRIRCSGFDHCYGSGKHRDSRQ